MAETPYLGVKKFSAEDPVDLNDINVNWDKIDAGVSQVKDEIDSINLIPGPEGPEGPAGPTGATGPTGPAGQAGRTIREGSGDPSSGVGVNGDFYIDKANWRIWGPKTSGSWSGTGPTSIIGPKGDPGPQGIQGPAGPVGPQGLQGSVGAKGSTGPQGPIGPTGARGPKGDTGERGLQGPAGQAGPPGIAGPKGDPGEDAASIDNGLMAVDDVSLSWSQSTRRIEVTPTGDDFTFWVAGKKFTSEGDFLILPAGPALWWVYYSDDGELVSSTSRWDPGDACPIATVLISTEAPYSIVLDRRAAITMGATTREILLAGGSSVTSGLALSDSSYAIQPPAPVADDNEFGVDAGSIAVADRGFTILSMADGGPYDIFYRDGASWAWGRDQALPYLVGSTYLQADVDGVLTDLASGQYVNYWLITWPEISGEAPFGIIVGQTIHEYADDAQAERFSSLDLVGLDPDAVVPLWRITYEVSSVWNGVAGRSRIHSIMSHSTEVEAVRRSGDKMAGPLDLAGHPLTGLPAPATDSEPVRPADAGVVVAPEERAPLARWRQAVANGTATIVAVGDSLTERTIGTSWPTPMPLSWLSRLDARVSTVEGTIGQPAGEALSEEITSQASAWTTDGSSGVGLAGYGVALTGSETATRTRGCDGIELIFLDGGIASVVVDGGSPVLVDTDGGTVWSSGPLAWGVHSVSVAVDSGTVVLSSSRWHAGTLGRIVSDNGGHRGQTWHDHLQQDTVAHIELVQPDLVVLSTGLNDWRTGRPVVDDLTALVGEIRAVSDCSILVMVGHQPLRESLGIAYDAWTSSGTPEHLRREAHRLGCAVVDLAEILGDPAPRDLFVDVDGSGGMDGVHPNAAGHEAIADQVTQVLLAGVTPREAPASRAALTSLESTVANLGPGDVGALPAIPDAIHVDSTESTAGAWTVIGGRAPGDTHDRGRLVVRPEALGGVIPHTVALEVGPGDGPTVAALSAMLIGGQVVTLSGGYQINRTTLPAPPAGTARIVAQEAGGKTEVGVQFPGGFTPLAIEDGIVPEIAGRVSRAGDTMAGPLDLDGHAITGLPAPVEDTSPVRVADIGDIDGGRPDSTYTLTDIDGGTP